MAAASFSDLTFWPFTFSVAEMQRWTSHPAPWGNLENVNLEISIRLQTTALKGLISEPGKERMQGPPKVNRCKYTRGSSMAMAPGDAAAPGWMRTNRSSSAPAQHPPGLHREDAGPPATRTTGQAVTVCWVSEPTPRAHNTCRGPSGVTATCNTSFQHPSIHSSPGCSTW